MGVVFDARSILLLLLLLWLVQLKSCTPQDCNALSICVPKHYVV